MGHRSSSVQPVVQTLARTRGSFSTSHLLTVYVSNSIQLALLVSSWFVTAFTVLSYYVSSTRSTLPILLTSFSLFSGIVRLILWLISCVLCLLWYYTVYYISNMVAHIGAGYCWVYGR